MKKVCWPVEIRRISGKESRGTKESLPAETCKISHEKSPGAKECWPNETAGFPIKNHQALRNLGHLKPA
jgi:hypothetical protein